MKTITKINPPGTEAIYKAYKFSQAMVCDGIVEVSHVLEAAGSDLRHVLHLTQYLTNIEDARAVTKVFAEFFPNDYPACTVVQVVALVLPQLKIEIQARAVVKD